MDDPGDRDSRRTRNAHCLGTSAPFPPYPPYPPNPPYPPYAPYPIPRRPLPQNVPPPAGTDAGGSGGGPGGGGQLGDGAREPPLVFPDSVVVRRPDDLLVCTLRFVGFAFLRDPPRLVRAAAESLIILEFPPQSFGEEAFLLVSGQSVVPDKTQEVTNNKDYPPQNAAGTDATVPTNLPAARIRMAGASRVVVAMPDAQESVKFDLSSVLNALAMWPMRLAPGAVAGSATGPGPQPPGSAVTALELPYRLLLSPLQPASWRHSIPPVTLAGRTELWHTRLANPVDTNVAEPPSRIRAIWSPDYRPPAQLDSLYKLIGVPGPPGAPAQFNPALIRMSLDPVDRAMLVTLMAGYEAKLKGGQAYLPISSEAKRLHLSALGGALDAEGNWTTLPDGIDLTQWRHQATLGRDHYVRVVYAGYLCSFGHAASLVKVTERQFQPIGGDPRRRMAMLRQRFFIVVRERVRHYSGAGHVDAGRTFPFTQVEILTTVTPDLAEPGVGASRVARPPSGEDPYAGITPRMLFWPMVPGAPGAMTDMMFQIAATDIAGNRITFAMPLLFVGKAANDHARADKQGVLRKAYNAVPAVPRRQAGLGGATVTYAPADPSGPGDSTLPTTTVTFRAGDLIAPGDPDFYPEVDRAMVGIKAVQKLLAQPKFATEVAYPDVYAKNGFGGAANAGEVFLQVTAALPLQFGGQANQAKSDALGALATPQMNVLGLSRITGLVAGQNASTPGAVAAALGKVSQGTFDPADFFGNATLLGGIKLSDVVRGSLALGGQDVPKLLSRDFPDRVEASFDWNGRFVPGGNPLLIPDADPAESETRLVMNGTIRTPLDPAQASSFQATAVLNNFKVNLFGFIILWFESLQFTTKSGQKPDVAVNMRSGDDAVAFGGPLEFVNEIRKYIPSNGFSDPPSLEVTPSGISASYTLNLPAIEVGVFALANLGLSASFSLPFDGTPAFVKFAFSTREHPFSLTVSLLGGGGYFGIGIGSDGVREIEAALEFGAVLAINLGVASGTVEVKAGIYFHWLEPTPGQGSVELAGYVRIYGECSVLGLISVALTFNLQLGFEKAGGKTTVYGEAKLTVEIDILFFSTSVSVHCRREFSGGPADPKFIDLIPTQAIWSEYCNAFAAEPA